MKSNLNNLLIVEDNSIIKKKIFKSVKNISNIGQVFLADTLQAAFSFLDNQKLEIIILDLNLPDGYGIEVLNFIKEKHLETKVFIFSLSTDLKNAYLKKGAFSFFDKANEFDELIQNVKTA